jgi:sugar phosphate isomerase/epimerase
MAGGAIVHTHAKDGLALDYIAPDAFYHMFAQYGLDWAREATYCKEVPLGEGSVRWEAYLKALKDIGYDGYLTIEREITNGSEDIRAAVRFLSDMLNRI